MKNLGAMTESITTKSVVRLIPWHPGQRVMRPDLEDRDFTGSNIHNISEMNRAAFIANRAIARMMRGVVG